MEADKDGDGRLSFEEFTNMVANTVRASLPHFPSKSHTIPDHSALGHRETNDTRGPLLTPSSSCIYTSSELSSPHLHITRLPCHEPIRYTDITDGNLVMMIKRTVQMGYQVLSLQLCAT